MNLVAQARVHSQMGALSPADPPLRQLFRLSACFPNALAKSIENARDNKFCRPTVWLSLVPVELMISFLLLILLWSIYTKTS
jgi:hypothetical protein